MPNFDGTGPQGQGPKTGRGLGNCEKIESREGLEQRIEVLEQELKDLKQELKQK